MSTRIINRAAPTLSKNTPTADFEKFCTIGQVADCLEVSTRTVRRWIKKKLLVTHGFKGVVRISEADFRSFLAAHRDH